MKKTLLVAMASLLMFGLVACGSSEKGMEQGEKKEPSLEPVIISVKEAEYSGEGPSRQNEKIATALDETTNTITNLGEGSVVTYTVPEGVEGEYDIYITISKCLAAASSQPFDVSINGGDRISFPLAYKVGGDSEFAYNTDGEYDTGSLTDLGLFPVRQSVTLKAGDTITFDALYGSMSAAIKGRAFPDLGDLYLYEAGAPVEIGYEGEKALISEEVNENDPLSGKTIIWLGSSVTFGAHAGGYYSMADALEDNHPGLDCQKYAVNATTLVNANDKSYVARMKTIDTSLKPDFFIVQLSTNDATTKKPMGELSDSFEMEDFDDTTIYGAMETIVAYVKEVYGCPVIFYTGTYFESEEYANMVDAVLKVQEKWDIGVIDMYNNPEMKALYGTPEYDEYMSDTVHPFRKGYVEWWTPVFEEYLLNYEK